MTATNAPKSAPLYVQFAQALRVKCQELGLEPLSAGTETGFPQNENYFFVRFGTQDAAALIVPKSKLRMGMCDVHIDVSTLEGGMALKKKNGKVLSHFAPDVDLIAKHVLPRLPGASKRATIVASGSTQKAPVAEPAFTPIEMWAEGEGELSDGEAELQTVGGL
jgi:hypothetical protein